jgi:AcrR family transcriptional regulator
MTDRSVRERLIEEAVQLFAEKGFAGTSTREIARLADVNETSLFRVFGNKEDLFWTALKSRLGQVRLRKELQRALAEDAEPQLVVPQIVEFLVQTTVCQPEVIRLLNTSLMEMRPQAEVVHRQTLAPIFQDIAGYLARGMERGALRAVDPVITTTSLAATVLSQLNLSQVLNGLSRPYANTEEAVAAYSDYWLTMLTPTKNTCRNAPLSLSCTAGPS